MTRPEDRDRSASGKRDAEEQASGRPGVDGWDRVGKLIERVGEAGESIAQRHLKAWQEVSASLRADDYRADDWARNSARVMSTAIDDANDVWRIWAPPDSEPAAGVLPTVSLFLEVDPQGQGEDTLSGVEWIAVPRSVDSPPDRADVVVSGLEPEAAAIVREAVKVTLDAKARKYVVQFTAPAPARRPGLKTGIYAGLIFVQTANAAVPLADLRVVVRTQGSF